MVNKKQLEILQQGVEAWNQWRKGNPDIKPNLSGANLRSANLEGGNLRSAYLTSANLEGGNLRSAYLTRARLTSANLEGANLEGANLRSANLRSANLRSANLLGAYLKGAKLEGAYLEGAYLEGAYLEGAYLRSANLEGANLEGANLSGANLEGAYLEGAYLKGAYLKGAYLSGAYLEGANLKGAKLEGANLSGAKLTDFNLNGANLSGAKLTDFNLNGANLNGANLSGCDLSGCDLSGCDLSGCDLQDRNFSGKNLISTNFTDAVLIRIQALATNFEGATLTGACIEDWNINSQTNLQNVKCDYIYLKGNYSEEEKKWIFRDRIPHDPNKIFAPGEFTNRYQKILETVSLYFGAGIDWQVFLASFQKLQEEEKLKLEAEGSDRTLSVVQTIENTGDGSFVIKVGVPPDIDKGEYEKSFWQKYQPMLEAAEEKYRSLLDAKEEQIHDFRQQNSHLMRVLELQAGQQINVYNNLNNQQGEKNVNQQKPGNTYNQSGNIGIGHNEGEIKGNAKVAGVINEAAQQDLTQAAAEIQQLLEQLSKTNPTETFAQKGAIADMTIQEIENNPTLKQKIISSLKAMGIEAFMEAIDHPVANVLRAGIEAYREPN